MPGSGVEEAGQVADVFTAVGDERDLLVGRHPVGVEHLEQAPFRFGVIGLHVPEAGRFPVGGHDFAGDHLEPAIASGSLGGGVDVAAIEADGDR